MQRESRILVAPSVLSADFSKMGEEIASVEKAGADMIHLDVMDGVFVPNITFGIKMVEDVRKITSLPLDCHLMIVSPEKYVGRFAAAGADYVTVHAEACGERLKDVLELIGKSGAKRGVAINPDTPWERIESVIPACDLILVMWEDQILSACVDIDLFSKIFFGHDRALDMPARTAVAPR